MLHIPQRAQGMANFPVTNGLTLSLPSILAQRGRVKRFSLLSFPLLHGSSFTGPESCLLKDYSTMQIHINYKCLSVHSSEFLQEPGTSH
jgi:hypothetical protein